MGDILETKEKIERIDITDGERRIGCASVRYPVFDKKRIDSFYQRQAEAFISYAKRKKLCGMLNCRVTYEDEEIISVITEARIYKDNECLRRHRSSFVWDKRKGRLRYIRKKGIRRCNITYDGTELSIFD